MDTRLNDDWTVEKLKDTFGGADFKPSDTDKDHFICDWCSIGVKYGSGPRVATYIADNVLNPNHPVWQQYKAGGGERTIVPLATYCEDCATRKLLFPCQGYGECRIMYDLDADQIHKNVEVTDVSPRDDGIPWDPIELTERVMQVQFETQEFVAALTGSKDLWGPENMVTWFLAVGSGIDIRELVKWNGEIDPKVLGRARSEMESFRQKMNREGNTRKAFRDHVRGDDQ
jgi:hypothetical protein